MSNHNDEPYDDVPECCCAGIEDNEKLKREIVELKAMVNELRDAMSHTIRKLGGHLTLETALSKTSAQSLHEHDMAIAEAVLEECMINSYGDLHATGAERIRNIDLAAIVNGVK